MKQENSKMKICCFSDTHGLLPDVPECDLALIAGDIVPLRVQRDTPWSLSWFRKEFLPWVEKQPCKKIIMVWGNHDFVGEAVYRYPKPEYSEKTHEERLEAMKEVLGLEGTKLEILLDSSTEFMGKTFYGTPWCPNLYNWAFYKNSDDLEKIFKKIPESVDFLISHSPGKGCNKTGMSLEKWNRPEYGSEELAQAVLNRKGIKWWVCGHIHSGNHNITELINGTKVVNVSLLGEDYKERYPILELFIV